MTRLSMIWLVSTLGMCAGPGDFCDIYTPVPKMDRTVAQIVVSQERPTAEAISTNERVWRMCQ